MILTDKNLNIIDEAAPWAVRQPDSVLGQYGTAWNTKNARRIRAGRPLPPLADAGKKKWSAKCLRFSLKSGWKNIIRRCAATAFVKTGVFLPAAWPAGGGTIFITAIFDVSSFKLAAQMWYPKIAEKIKDAKPAAHQALDDIRASIEEMREYANTMLIPLPLPDGESSGEK